MKKAFLGADSQIVAMQVKGQSADMPIHLETRYFYVSSAKVLDRS